MAAVFTAFAGYGVSVGTGGSLCTRIGVSETTDAVFAAFATHSISVSTGDLLCPPIAVGIDEVATVTVSVQ